MSLIMMQIADRDIQNRNWRQHKDWERLLYEDRTSTVAEIGMDSHAWSASRYKQHYLFQAISFIAVLRNALS